jgi:hypothetical protein
MSKKLLIRIIRRKSGQLQQTFRNLGWKLGLSKLSKINQPNFRRRSKAGFLSLFFITSSLSFLFSIGIPEPALAAPTMNVLIRDPSDGGDGTTGVSPFVTLTNMSGHQILLSMTLTTTSSMMMRKMSSLLVPYPKHPTIHLTWTGYDSLPNVMLERVQLFP